MSFVQKCEQDKNRVVHTRKNGNYNIHSLTTEVGALVSQIANIHKFHIPHIHYQHVNISCVTLSLEF